ncbi:MAG: glycosyltransferase family 2 protein [Proteobacteria bacterium]|nr:glycosyltransferase family 2 protein [Pseudomonadota bacterium]
MPARLSAIVPARDHSHCLPEAVTALAAQHRAPDEIWVVNDGSRDDTAARLRGLAQEVPSLRVLENAEPEGCPAAVMRGAAAATGELLFIQAADDVVLPGFFAQARTLLAAHANVGACVADHTQYRPEPWVGPQLTLTDRTLPLPKRPARYGPEALADAFDGGWNASPATVWRRDAFLASGGFNPAFEEYADWFALMSVAFTEGVAYAPRLGTAFRVQPGSWSHRGRRDRERLARIYRLMVERLRAAEHRVLAERLARSAALDELPDVLAAFPDADTDPWLRTLLAGPKRRAARRAQARAGADPRWLRGPSLDAPIDGPAPVRDVDPRVLREHLTPRICDWRQRGLRVVVHGAGEVMENGFRLTPLDRAPVVAVVEPVPWLQGQRVFGLPVVAPEELPSLEPDVVLVASLGHQANIASELRTRLPARVAVETALPPRCAP